MSTRSSLYQLKQSRAQCGRENPAGQVGLTLCQQVELVHEEGLVLGPGKVEGLGRHELRHTVLLVVGVMLQLGDTVEATGLEAEGGGRCL